MPNSNRSPLIDRAAFAQRLQAAIERKGLTYEEIARQARAHLPPSERLSAVSVWQYAKGKSFPRRMSYIEALGKVLGEEPDKLLVERAEGSPAPEPEAPQQRPENRTQSQVRIADLGRGFASLYIEAELPWPIALRIVEILKGGSDPSSGG